jgi:hypothetical protein
MLAVRTNISGECALEFQPCSAETTRNPNSSLAGL